MAFSTTIPGIAYRKLVLWQNLDSLAENDAFIRAALQGYRRPVLQWISATAVDVENNTGNQNETKIVFPDMDVRVVTENTSSTDKYRRFNITATAEFTSGTENSGLRSGISENNNTWYAIYAVKSQIDPTKFVLAGDTTLPLQANISTLNSRYGENSWIYLGMIRNGDSDPSPGDILDFVQSGTWTRFKNTSDAVVGGRVGIQLAAGTDPSWSVSRGTGSTQVPDHLDISEFAAYSNDDDPFALSNVGATRFYLVRRSSAVSASAWVNGFLVKAPTSGGIAMVGSGVLALTGCHDKVLGVGFNPLF